MDKETRKLLEEMKCSNGYVSVAELAERFEEVDEYYNHELWNLTQILSNINILIPIEIKSAKYNVNNILKEYRALIKDYEDNGYSFHISHKVEDLIRKGGLDERHK